MRNKSIEVQINNMILSVDTFLKSLEYYALQDDGVVSKDEKAAIRQLTKASVKYTKSLEKVKSK